ncbi:peptidoglycan-binding protein [Streptomyces sp. C10-9-1]|uniref:peptidoglycan-binding domain-containing protein n=1 Tax=Streptomyces sp. C10-9-1 TaxID=1859285 RepID=UPI002112AF38|nr:peptidoglycan-binding protein [Streptomyces sp. C10-9-1]MCQ6551952.1 peptidoglycan-binding protein [Streptomyces sp. C10-9-1]
MAQTVCLHCGAAAPPRPAACPCAAARTGAPEGAEPFEWLRVRPSAEAPAPPRRVRAASGRGRPVEPAGAGGHLPVPPDRVWGIVQPPFPGPSPRDPAWAAALFDGYASAATGPEAYPHPCGAPPAPHDASGGPGATAGAPAEVLPDDTVRLRRVPEPAPDAPAAPGRARGRHRARGRGAGRHARTAAQAGGPARTAGIAAAAAAVVGTVTLTGTMVNQGASVDRVAPVTTRLPAPDEPTSPEPTSPAPTSPAPTTPGPSPSPSPSADDGPASASRAPSASPTRTARPRIGPPPEADAPRIATERRRPTSAPPPAPPRPSRSPATGRPSAPAAAADLCCGARGMEVVDLQIRLQRLGLYKGEADGAYNRRLTRAVASYQRSRGVRADPRGVYGPETRAALRAEVPGILAY